MKTSTDSSLLEKGDKREKLYVLTSLLYFSDGMKSAESGEEKRLLVQFGPGLLNNYSPDIINQLPY